MAGAREFIDNLARQRRLDAAATTIRLGSDLDPVGRIAAIARTNPPDDTEALIAVAMERLMDEIRVTFECIVAGQQAIEEG